MAAVVDLYQKHIPRLQEWSRLIVKVGSAQALLQIIGVLSGILIIHQLNTHEYALYTIANTMLGTMTVLADGGISLAVMAEGGKVYLKRDELGVVLVTGLKLRKSFALVALLIVSPILFYLLYTHGASALFSSLMLLALIPAFLAALSDSVLEIVPKLHQDIGPLQKNEITAGLGRLVMISGSLLIFPWAYLAILMNGIPRWWANIQLKKISAKYADFDQQPDPVVSGKIMAIVKRSLPEIIYYCLSGQLTIWLISIFGKTSQIAQIGAIGRLSATLALFSTLISILLVPRFSRHKGGYKVLLKIFLTIVGAVAVLSLFIVGFCYLFSTQLLWVLGKQYQGLEYYLQLSFIGSCVTLLTGTIFFLYSSKGWIINPVFLIPFNILLLVCGVFLFNLSTLEGVLLLNIFIASLQMLMHLVFGLKKIYQLKAVPGDAL